MSASPEKEEHKFDQEREVHATRYMLLQEYGISDLSQIELWHLRHIVEECYRSIMSDCDRANRGETKGSSITSVDKESAAQWLFRIYGISHEHAYDQATVGEYSEERKKDGKEPKQIIYHGCDIEKAICMYREGRRNAKNSHSPLDYLIYYSVSDAMQEHIAIIREETGIFPTHTIEEQSL